MLLASFKNKQKSTTENVVVKKLLSSSRSDEKQKFFKEARLLNSLSHKNITSFKKVCIEQTAIMMEFVAFEFKRRFFTKSRIFFENRSKHSDQAFAKKCVPPSFVLKVFQKYLRRQTEFYWIFGYVMRRYIAKYKGG